MNAEHYTYRVRWSAEDGEHVGTVAEFPSLSWLAADADSAFDGIRAAVREALEDMTRSGEEPPVPLGEREFSGRFLVRITPEAHRRLAMDAAEQNVSLNRMVSQRLAAS